MNHHPSSSHVLGLLALSLAATSVAAQSQLPPAPGLDQGQIVAAVGDAPIGAPASALLTNSFDNPFMDHNGAILFRCTMAGGAVTTLQNRGLFYGHTKGDMAMIVQTGVAEPSGTLPNTTLNLVTSATGVASSSNTLTKFRVSPRNNFIVFTSTLSDGGNPGADGVVSSIAGGTINNTALYWGQPGAFQILARQAITTMPVAQGSAALIGAFSSFSDQQLAMSASGTTIFQSNLSGGDVSGTTNDTAYIIGTPGSLNYFLRENDVVNGGNNVIPPAGLGFNVILNNNGLVLHDEKFSQSLGAVPATPFDDQVLMVTDTTTGYPYTHQILAREGDVANDSTGAPIPGVFIGPPAPVVALSNNGYAAYSGTLTGAVTASVDNFAIFAGPLGGVKMAVRRNDPIPGTGGELVGVQFTGSMSYAENHGVVVATAFQTPLVAATVNTDSALLLAKPGSPLVVIAREGDACPGMPGFFFGNITGSTGFGSATSSRINERGHVLFGATVNDGTNNVTVTYSWNALHGLQLQVASGDTWGGGIVSTPGIPLALASGDGDGGVGLNRDGDFVMRTSVTPTASFIARGHVGSLQGIPSAVPVAGGVPQNFAVDVTPALAGANRFYFILASDGPTNPGFTSPFGGQNVPLDPFDPIWLPLSLNNPNSIVWPFTAAPLSGSGTNFPFAPAFVMPAGFPIFLGTTLHHAAVILDLSFGIATTHVTEPVPCYLY